MHEHTGPGTVFDSAGLLLTNAYVVGQQTRLSTGAVPVPVTLVASYPPDDVAVIKVAAGPGLRLVR